MKFEVSKEGRRKRELLTFTSLQCTHYHGVLLLSNAHLSPGGGGVIINDEAYEYCTIEFTCYLKGVHKLVGLG
jgi:hypothetical protein